MIFCWWALPWCILLCLIELELPGATSPSYSPKNYLNCSSFLRGSKCWPTAFLRFIKLNLGLASDFFLKALGSFWTLGYLVIILLVLYKFLLVNNFAFFFFLFIILSLQMLLNFFRNIFFFLFCFFFILAINFHVWVGIFLGQIRFLPVRLCSEWSLLSYLDIVTRETLLPFKSLMNLISLFFWTFLCLRFINS